MAEAVCVRPKSSSKKKSKSKEKTGKSSQNTKIDLISSAAFNVKSQSIDIVTEVNDEQTDTVTVLVDEVKADKTEARSAGESSTALGDLNQSDKKIPELCAGVEEKLSSADISKENLHSRTSEASVENGVSETSENADGKTITDISTVPFEFKTLEEKKDVTVADHVDDTVADVVETSAKTHHTGITDGSLNVTDNLEISSENSSTDVGNSVNNIKPSENATSNSIDGESKSDFIENKMSDICAAELEISEKTDQLQVSESSTHNQSSSVNLNNKISKTEVTTPDTDTDIVEKTSAQMTQVQTISQEIPSTVNKSCFDQDVLEIAATPTPSRDPDPGGSTYQPSIHYPVPGTLPTQAVSESTDDGQQIGAVVPDSEVRSRHKITPFTEEQLRTFYFNPELERNETFVENFLQEITQDKHEFYELVLNYFRSTNLLISAEQDVRSLETDLARHKDLVWSEMEHQLPASGHCRDNVRVNTVHTFYTAVCNTEACTNLSRTLKDVRTKVHENLSLHAYTVQLSRLQVESYIHELYKRSPALSSIPHNAPVTAMMSHARDVELSQQVEALKTCISILFMFQRRPAKDKQFFQDTQQWLSRMVATLLRLGTLEDHLYLLNQLLRCPAGVGRWGGQFVQVLQPGYCEGQSSLDSPLLDHFIAMLATLMIPPRQREELLYRLKIKPSEEAENPWVLVDSDGEEDEDTENAWMYLHENDLVTLLNQFPLDYIFRHVLLVRTDHDGSESYLIQRTSEHGMMRLFAFTTCLIRILSQGLRTYSMSRYRQLNKRIARMIRHSVQYLSDHCLNYQSMIGSSQPDLGERLSVEFDQVFLRATENILAAQKLGSWQFMADMPYTCVTMTTMWKLVWLMHDGYKSNQTVSDDVSVEECKAMMEDPDSKIVFEDKLMAMPMSEAIYLLTTFANMARSRREEESDFVEAITVEIFEISYISNHSREFCSKVGRELLASIASDHPFILSVLLNCMKNNLEKIGIVCLYLVSELPYSLWDIKPEDMNTLHQWVLNKDLCSVENQLARAVLAKLNWGYDEQAVNLKLDVSVHRQMALLLVEAYNKHIHGKQSGNFLTESIRQVASVVTGVKMTDEQQFSQWAWDITLRLHLHANTQPRPVLGSPSQAGAYVSQLPDMNTDPSLHGLAQGVRENTPLASYIALMMTKIGHSVSDFIADGLPLLSCLASLQHYVPAVYALSYITPLFFESPDYLSKNEKFLSVLQAVVGADQGRLPHSIFAEFPGPVLKFLTCMIQNQIHLSHFPGAVATTSVISFWLTLITSRKTWYTDRCLMYVMDSLCKATFRCKGGQQMAHQFISNLYKDLVKVQKDQNMLSSIVTWISSGNTLPSFIEQQSVPEFSWLSYYMLLVESEYEDATTLWPAIQKELLNNPSIPFDQALRKSSTSLHLEVSPSPQRLSIFRWAYQAMDMHLERSALPLIWQQFFRRYLARLAAEPGLPERGSVGEKFFDSVANTTLLKRMKKRLNEAADHYHRLATDTDKDDGDNPKEDGLLEQTKYSANKEFYNTLVKFYETLAFWLDEPRLHDPKLYLPALPPQYQAEYLLQLFQNQKEPWMDFVDWGRVDYELAQMASEWTTNTNKNICLGRRRNSMQEVTEPNTATKRILQRLNRNDPPAGPPPIVPLKAPVPEVQTAVLCDKSALLYSLRTDYELLTDYAKLFALRVSKHVHLDMSYTEMLPELYKNEMTETRLEIPCKSTFSISHKCKGPALVNVQYECKQRDDMVARKLDENRAEYKQVMIESFLPPASTVCGAAVHVENAIIGLIRLHQSPPDAASHAAIVEAGTALFYQMASNISDETKYYPPTRQFFSSCIEILGQEFIRNNPEQSQPLLQAILKMPTMAGLLSPNFCPNTCPELFVTMYEDILQVTANQGAELAFVLLTKFDMDQWLKNKPPLSQRSNLIEVISRGLSKCGLKPQESSDNQHLVYELYRNHLKKIAVYQYPNHYADILKLLLKGSATKSLSVDCWWDFLSCIGCSTQRHDDEMDPKTASSIQSLLSMTHLKDTIDWLGSYFMRQRTSDTNSASFGLYPAWQPYVSPLSCLLAFIVKNLCNITVSEMSSSNGSPDIALREVWTQLIDAFSPWIQPLDNSGQILSPWIESDRKVAMEMLEAFVDCLQCMLIQFEGLIAKWCCGGVLALVWLYYCQQLALPGTPDHVLQGFHTQLLTLPWEKFCPGAPAFDLMLKIGCEGVSHSCVVFLSCLFTKMDWLTIVHHYSASSTPDVVVKVHMCILELMVRFGSDTEVFEVNSTEMARTFNTVETLNWNVIDAHSYNHMVQTFLHHANPRCVLLERTANMALVLNLLKIVSGFYHSVNPDVNPETPVKRCTFIRCVVEMVVSCSHQSDAHPETFQIIITNLLTEVEAVAGTVVDLYQQQQEAVAMTTEVLGLLNNSSSQGGTQEVILSTVKEWVACSPTSLLLVSLITAVCRTLASVRHMVELTECCIDAHFSSNADLGEYAGWNRVLTALEIPELTRAEFLTDCQNRGAYLTLYTYVLQMLPLSHSLQEEETVMKMLIGWNAKAHPRQENEAKLYLWWSKIIELALRQVEFGGSHRNIVQNLHSFVSVLTTLGEDKVTTGLLGAIGLGRKSQLSLKFRLIARSMATFIQAQIPNEHTIRLLPNALGSVVSVVQGPRVSPSSQAVNALSHLDALKTNKHYVELHSHIAYVVHFISNPAHSLVDAHMLLSHLVTQLYPDVHYVRILQLPHM